MNAANQHLTWGERFIKLGTDDRCFDIFNQGFDHRQRHIRLEQRHAYLPERVSNIVFGQAAFAAQPVYHALQSFSQFIKHRNNLTYP